MIGFFLTLVVCIILGVIARNHQVNRDTVKGTILGGGVCAGIARTFKIEPIWIRLAFVLSVIIFGFGVMLYIILWIVMEEE